MTDKPSGVSWEVWNEDCVLIHKLYVRPEHRRQGLGRKLLKQAIQEAKEKHPDLPIEIDAQPGDSSIKRKDLVRFYESCGFGVYKITSRKTYLRIGELGHGQKDGGG